MPHATPLRAILSAGLLLSGIGCAASNSGSATGSGGSGGTPAGQAGDTGAGGTGTGGASTSPYAAKALHVMSNKLVDTTGATVRLLGVNRDGTEYRCATGSANTTFDGPTGPNTIQALLDWHVNAVRLPLNEQCWLGINGLPIGGLSADTYQAEIQNYVSDLHSVGMYAILDLHWTGNATTAATKQTTMADADHAIDFWTSVASFFKDDPMVLFDLYNEPILDDSNNNPAQGDPWACWQNGCTTQQGWRTAGMQQMVSAVRGAGAGQVIIANGLNWSSKLDSWLTHKPNDSNVVAGFHVYMNGGRQTSCRDTTCWNSVPASVARNVPLVIGEFGEFDCASTAVAGLMSWADSNGASYLAWAFNPQNCSTTPALITDWTGATTAFGAGVKSHLMSVN
jgi:endoglucanase